MSPRGRPAAGGGRWVEIAPERMPGWLDRFAARHGGARWRATRAGLYLTGADGGTADCRLPFGWPPGHRACPPADTAGGRTDAAGTDAGAADHGAHDDGTARPGGADPAVRDDFLAAASHERVVALLLVRRRAHAVGVAAGSSLLASKVDTRYVQGRTAAGGWSQQRFARRRDNQTRESAAAAAGHVVRVLEAAVDTPTGLVTGGDRALVDAVLADRRLAHLAGLPRAPFLDVPEPRRQTLVSAAQRYRSVHVRLVDPPPD